MIWLLTALRTLWRWKSVAMAFIIMLLLKGIRNPFRRRVKDVVIEAPPPPIDGDELLDQHAGLLERSGQRSIYEDG